MIVIIVMMMLMVVMTVMMLISFWIVRVMHFMCSQIKHSGHNQKTSHPDDAIRQRKRGIFFRSKIWRKKIRAENISSRRIYSWGEKDVDSWIILIKVINATSHRQGGRGRQPFGNPKLPNLHQNELYESVYFCQVTWLHPRWLGYTHFYFQSSQVNAMFWH